MDRREVIDPINGIPVGEDVVVLLSAVAPSRNRRSGVSED